MNQVNNDKPREYAINPEENWIEDWEPHWPNPTDPVIRVIEYTAYEELKEGFDEWTKQRLEAAEFQIIEEQKEKIQALLEIIRKQDEALRNISSYNKNDDNPPPDNKGPDSMAYWRWQELISRDLADKSREQTALSLKEIGVSL